jgi:hypothetical protein
LSVLRAKAGIGAESTVGMIYTSGDPGSNTDNSLTGVDYLYRNSRLPGGRTLEAFAWYQQTDTPGLDGDDSASAVGFSMPSNVGVRAAAVVKEFERNFNPALGFMSRGGVRQTAADVGYTLRPAGGLWQSVFFSLEADRFDEIDGGLQSKGVSITPLELTSRQGNVLWLRSNFDTEVLTQPFEIYPGVVIPTGQYSFENHGIEIRRANFRKVAGRIAYVKGSFYSGDQVRIFGNFTWQPSPKFRTSIGYNVTEVELPQGNFTTRLLSTGIDWVFSSTLSWVNLIQYDNVSEVIGINSRLHWIPQAGREAYIVLNHNLTDLNRDNHFVSTYGDLTLKLAYTWRF